MGEEPFGVLLQEGSLGEVLFQEFPEACCMGVEILDQVNSIFEVCASCSLKDKIY